MSARKAGRARSPAIDLNQLVDFVPHPGGGIWESTEGSKRRGLRGTWIGNINLRHSSGYEVVLQLQDGSISSFAPSSLRPVTPGTCGAFLDEEVSGQGDDVSAQL